MLLRTILILFAAVAVGFGCENAKEDHHGGHDQDAPHHATEKGAMQHHGGKVMPMAAGGMNRECPVMGGEVDPDVYTEYRGRKVYFCCEDCLKDFQKDPETYFRKAYPGAK